MGVLRYRKDGAWVDVATATDPGALAVLADQLGAPNGVATLDENGILEPSQSGTIVPLRPEQFGAVGDGVTDDYAAWIALAAAVNAAGTAVIDLAPGANYLIDQIVVTGNGIVDPTIDGVDGLTIRGNGATITLKGGWTRSVNTTRHITPIRLLNCTDVLIENLDIYGQGDTVIRGVGVTEPNSYGIGMFAVERATMRNIRVRHILADGIYLGATGNVACKHVVGENVSSENNGRQGMSVTQARFVKFTNSRFVNTGRTYTTAEGHSPTGGVDVEPNVLAPTMDVNTGKVVFENCEFRGNRGSQFVAINHMTDDIMLKDCEFVAATDSTLYTVILAVDNGLIEGGTIDTSTSGDVYPVWNSGTITNRRTTLRGVTIYSKKQGILIASENGQGFLIENCRLIGQHTASLGSANFPYILPPGENNGIFRNNYIFVPAAAYDGSGTGHLVGYARNCASVHGNTWDTDLVPAVNEHFVVNYSGTTYLVDEKLMTGWKPNAAGNTWDIALPYTYGAVTVGSELVQHRQDTPDGLPYRIVRRPTVPSTGTWRLGDIVLHTNTTSGSGSLGWYCTAAGTPGTWSVLPPVGLMSASNTWTGLQTFAQRIARTPTEVNIVANGSTSQSVAATNYLIFNLSANVTSTGLTSPTANQILTVEYVQDATGGRTFVWPSAGRYAGGVAPANTLTANARDSVTFRYTGSVWVEIARAIGVV